jgi:hypothetical protein
MAGEPALQRGDSGEWVTYLQQQLNIWQESDPVVADGNFGEKTEAKVRDLQEGVGLSVTGVADEATWSTLLDLAQYTLALNAEQADREAHLVKVDVHDSFDFDGTVLKVWIGGAEHAVTRGSQHFDLQIFNADGSEFSWRATDQCWPETDVAAGEWAAHEHSFASNASPSAGEGYRYRVTVNRGKGERETTKEFAFDVGADGTIAFH